jgi:hypothetical protein
MSINSAHHLHSDILRLVVENIFLPPKLPQEDPGEQIEQKINVALCVSLIGAAQDFLRDVPSSQRQLWTHIIKMMELARRAAEVPFKEAELQHTLFNMAIGGISI